ncbi:fumarate hydratase [Paraburkholderia caribensis]|uniref:fumarate hydratase n=1 Tax=Paraburkholderia caribensis TaxID=75105 RepID=UPI0034D28CC4
MAISYDQLKAVTAQMYDRSLRRVPEDAKRALGAAHTRERSEVARNTLIIMLKSAEAAESRNQFVCSDAGFPAYLVRIGSKVTFEGSVKKAIRDGFKELTGAIDPPLLQHITNPLTLERSYEGKDMPIITFDVIDDADYIDITCSPKALGSGRWAALEIFTFPSLETIEKFILDTVIRAGSQACPPVVIGVGIGGSFDYAAKMAKEATFRRIDEGNSEPILAAMEERLLKAINSTGFGPMGTGGDTTAMAVHINYAAGHGFTPVAVCFNCWIDRRTRVFISNDGEVTTIE